MKTVVFLIFIVCSIASGQNKKIDSLKHIIEVASNDSNKVKSLIKLSALFMQEKPFLALDYARQALEISEEANFPYGKTEALYQIGYFYYQSAELKEALEKFIMVEKYSEKHGIFKYYLSAINNIAVINAQSGNIKLALEYFSKTLKVTRERKIINKWVLSLVNIGNCYVSLNEEKKAIENYLAANEIIEKNNFEYGKGLVLNNLSYAYYLLGDYVNGKKYAEESYLFAKKVNDTELVLESSTNLSNILIKTNQPDLAIKYATEGIDIASSLNAKKQLKDLYSSIVEAYIQKGDYKSVYFYQNKFQILKDSIFNEINAKLIAEMQAKYDTEKKNNDLKMKDSEIKNKDIQLYSGGLILTFFISGFVVVLYLLKKQKIAYRDLVNRNLEIVEAEQEIKVIKDYLTETEINKNFGRLNKEKYRNSMLSDDKKEKVVIELEKLMINNKPYLDKDLSIDKVANLLNTNTKYLSQIINEEFGDNFSTYINKLRIKEARRLLTSPDYENFSLEAIGEFVGFNTKPSFNVAFKKFTGITPSLFKEAASKNKQYPLTNILFPD